MRFRSSARFGLHSIMWMRRTVVSAIAHTHTCGVYSLTDLVGHSASRSSCRWSIAMKCKLSSFTALGRTLAKTTEGIQRKLACRLHQVIVFYTTVAPSTELMRTEVAHVTAGHLALCTALYQQGLAI